MKALRAPTAGITTSFEIELVNFAGPHGGGTVSASLDGTLRLWEMETGITVRVFSNEDLKCFNRWR